MERFCRAVENNGQTLEFCRDRMSRGMESPQRKRKAQDADPASTEKQRRVDTVDPEVVGLGGSYKNAVRSQG